MALGPLFRKELLWSRRHVLVLVFLLLVIPVFFAGASVVFQDIIPEDIPVAVIAEDDEVTDAEVELVAQSITEWTDPTTLESREEAEELLERESVYAIIVVPHGYLEPESSATFTLVIDGTIAPFQSPSELVQEFIEVELQDTEFISDDVSVEREIVGEERGFEEFLYPTFIMGLLLFFAFTYVPYTVRQELPVLDRLRVEASLEALLATKLVSLTALMVLPILVFHAVATYYGYGVDTSAPWAVGVLLLTFLFLSTVSVTIVVLARFSSVGQFVNLVVLLGLAGLSGLVFPLGFFSSLRTTIAQLLPTHYAMITVRSLMLKGSDVALFADWLAMLVVLQALALVALKGAVVYYRRTS